MKVEITKAILKSVRKSHSRYQDDLERKRKEKLKDEDQTQSISAILNTRYLELSPC